MIRPEPSSPLQPGKPQTARLLLLVLGVLMVGTACRTELRSARLSMAATGGVLKVSAETPVDAAPGSHPQVEPHVVVDPRDPASLVVAWMSVSEGPWEVRLARSTDGGRTWSRVPSPVAARTRRAFDPWLAWAPDGSALYLGLIEVSPGDGGGGGREVWRLPVFRSLDGGASWSRWGEVPGRTLDRLVVLAGPSSVHVLASEAVGDAPIVVARADAADGAFEILGRHRPPGGFEILSAAVSTDRGLVLSHTDRRSLQDRRPKPLTAVPFDGRARTFGEPRELGDSLFVGAPQLAFDGSAQSPYRGRLYSVAAQGRDRADGAASLDIAVSDDGGTTWSQPVALLPAGERVSFVTVPAVAVDGRGRLGVTWREHTGDLATGCSTVHFALSLDGGESFTIRRRVSSEPSCPDRPENRLDLGGIPFLDRWPGGGDYAGLAVGTDGVFHPVWADSRAGAWHIRTARVEVGPGGETLRSLGYIE